MPETTEEIGYVELATLKLVALEGALDGPTTVTCADLADRLGASNQTASRRLQRLENAEYLHRELTGEGQRVSLTDEGERALQREYAEYRRLFEENADVTLRGTVTSGMGEGRHYISLPGYYSQFRDRLGYEPFEGTLNVELDDESVRRRSRIDALEPIAIDGWTDDDRTYGPAFCWPASIETADGDDYDGCHVIAPERTHHDADQLEIIAPAKLRTEFDVADGDVLTIHISER